MQTVRDELGQIIDNLLLIKNNTEKISSIEKDILLQNLRDAYLLILRQPISEEVQVLENKEERQEDSRKNVVAEEVVEEKEEIREEEPQEEENEELDIDILEFVKDVPKAVFEEKTPIQEERDLFSTVEVKQKITTEPEPKSNPKPEIIPEPVVISESVPEVKSEPEPVVISEPVPEVKPEPEPVVISEPVPEVKPEPEPVVISEPVPEVKPEPEPVVVSEPVPEVKPEPEPVVISKPVPEVEIQSQIHFQPQPEVKPQQRSLNDLFNEKKQEKQDLGEKFQQTKITDLTKAMSISDKFLFIRELFKNKSEEFSHAIHTLNNCKNIEEAFEIMEGLKKQYFWDSTSSAYLALCDLVRRKY